MPTRMEVLSTSDPTRSLLRRHVLLPNGHPKSTREMEIAVPPDVLSAALARFEAGAYIQDAAPELDASEREFVLTGITPAEWDKLFPPPPIR